MATQFGCITEFQPATDAIKAYLKRVTLYFTANDVPEDTLTKMFKCGTHAAR